MKEDTNASSFYQQFSPMHSSRSLGWQGIDAARYLVPPGYASGQGGPPAHLLLLYLGEPSLIIQTSVASSHGEFVDTFVHKGSHSFMPAEHTWKGSWPIESDALFLHFEPALMHALLNASDIEGSRVELLPQPFVHDPTVEQLGLALLQEMHFSGINTRLYAESVANALALHMLRHYSTLQKKELSITSDLSKTRLRQVLQYMHEYSDRDLSVTELATIAGVSSSHFAHLFRQTMGQAPHQYLIAYRVEQAKSFLLQEDIPLHELALRCGFADQSHLTRHFQRLVGMTPGLFQKDRRNVLSFRRNIQDLEG